MNNQAEPVLPTGAGGPPGPCRQTTFLPGACNWPDCACHPATVTSDAPAQPAPRPLCLRCKTRPPTLDRRAGSRALCDACHNSCAACSRVRDTRHPAKSELCRRCYRDALGRLQRLLLDPEARANTINAIKAADAAVVTVLLNPATRAHKCPPQTRAVLADLAIALGGRP